MQILNKFFLIFMVNLTQAMKNLRNSRNTNCKLGPMHVPLHHLRRRIKKIIGVKTKRIEIIGPTNLIDEDSINLRSCLAKRYFLSNMLNKHIRLNEIPFPMIFLCSSYVFLMFLCFSNVNNILRTRRKASVEYVHLKKIKSSRRHCISSSSTSLEVKIGSQVFQ